MHLLEEYGECYKIGTSGLRDEIEEASKGFTLSSKPHYTSFKEHVTPYAVGHIGYNDITHMYYLGDVPDRLFEKLPTGESRYLVDRSKLEDVVDDVCSFDGKPVLVTGNLGSGKTIFVRQLIQRLHQKNVHIFTFEKYNSGTFSELASILQLPRTVLIIDNYSQCMDILDQLQFRVNRNFALVLTERSSIHRIKTNQFKKIFPVYKFCSLTELTSPEVEQLSYQIVSNQLDYDSSFRSQRQRCEMVERKIKDNCKSQFSAILLDMFGSNDIRQRLVQQFNASPKRKTQQLISFALFSTILNLRVTLTDMLELLDIDYVGLNLENDPTIQEFFNISDDHFQVRSSVIAKELLYQVQDVSVLIDALITVVDNIGDSYKDNFGHRELLKSLLSHSNFIPFLSSAGEANANEIYRFYDSVRNTPFCQQDPLFWEQFASACIDSNNFVDALSCLRTAFSRADAITGYVPYQIETVYARYLIESCLYDISIHPDFSAQSLMDCINKSYESLFKYYDYPDNQPPYTFATAKKYGTIWEKYSGQLSDSQRALFQSYIQDILKKVKTFYENSPMDAAKDPCYLALIQCKT